MPGSPSRKVDESDGTAEAGGPRGNGRVRETAEGELIMGVGRASLSAARQVIAEAGAAWGSR
jgi:hypothetical protein